MGNTASTAQPLEDTQTQAKQPEATPHAQTPGATPEAPGQVINILVFLVAYALRVVLEQVVKGPLRKPAGLKDSIHAVVEHNATRDAKQSPPARAKTANLHARTPDTLGRKPAAHSADAPNWALASPTSADCTCRTPPAPAPAQKKRPMRPGKRERQEKREALAAAAEAEEKAREQEREKERECEKERAREKEKERKREREKEREREGERETERERERERKRGGRRGRAAPSKGASGGRNHPDAENIPPHDSDSDSANEDRARARARRAPHEEQDVPEARKKTRRSRGLSKVPKDLEDSWRGPSSMKEDMQREACLPEGEEDDEEEVNGLLGATESVEREAPPHLSTEDEDRRPGLAVSDSGLRIGDGSNSGDKGQKDDEPALIPAVEASACCNPHCCAHGVLASKQSAVQKEPVTVSSQQAILLQLMSAAPAPTGTPGTPSAAGTPSARVITNQSTPSTLGRGASQRFGFGSPAQPYTPTTTANPSPTHPASAPAALPTPASAAFRERESSPASAPSPTPAPKGPAPHTPQALIATTPTPATTPACGTPPFGLYAPNARDAREIAREYAQKQIVQAMQTPPGGAASKYGTPLSAHNRVEVKHATPASAGPKHATPLSAGKLAHNHALPPVSVNKLAHAPLSASAHNLARPVQAHVPARFGGMHNVRAAPVGTPGSVRVAPVGTPGAVRSSGQALARGRYGHGRHGSGWGQEGERVSVGEVGWVWGVGSKSVGLGVGVVEQRRV